MHRWRKCCTVTRIRRKKLKPCKVPLMDLNQQKRLDRQKEYVGQSLQRVHVGMQSSTWTLRCSLSSTSRHVSGDRFACSCSSTIVSMAEQNTRLRPSMQQSASSVGRSVSIVGRKASTTQPSSSPFFSRCSHSAREPGPHSSLTMLPCIKASRRAGVSERSRWTCDFCRHTRWMSTTFRLCSASAKKNAVSGWHGKRRCICL